MLRKFFGLVRKNSLFFIGLILTTVLLWPLFKAPYFSHHDDVQVIRLHEMNECFSDFQIPCRWDPNLGGLYGYPLFNYYGPLPYYFGEVVYLVLGSFILSAKVMFAVSFLGSYVFMFAFTRKLWGNKGAFLSSLFYVYAPYHALDFYVRGAMGEMWALMFFPAVLLAVINLKDNPNIKKTGILGLTFAFLVMSHNLSAMIFVPVVTGFVILLYLFSKNKIFVRFSLLGILLGLSISAFYWIPSLGEKNLVHVETTTFGYFSYTEHFKGIRKLFFERMWGWGASVREIPGGERDGMSFQIGIVHLLAWIVTAFLFFINRKKSLALYIFIFCSIGIVSAVFMIHPRSLFLWKLIPPLAYLQFPWRFLMFIIFFISIAVGAMTIYLKGRVLKIFLLIFGVLLIVFNFFYFVPEKFFYVNDTEYLTGANWVKQIKRSIFDYLPKSAKFPPAELALNRYEVLKGDVEILNFKEGSNWMRFNTNSSNPSTIRLSIYYFPVWKVNIDGTNAKFNYDNDLGLITLDVPAGEHFIEARLHNTLLRTISNLVSLGSVVGLIIVFKKK